mgnify:FL=1
MHSLGVPFTLKERKLNFACEILVCGSSECPDVFEVRSFGSDERLLVVYVPPFLKYLLNLPLSGGKPRMRKDEPTLTKFWSSLRP